MKWPFVRRSKYEHLTKCLDAKNNVIANQMGNIKEQFNEINRLNQELANELNSHRETRECFQYTIDGLRIHNSNLEKELEETKDALKIAQEDLKVIKDHEQKLFEAHDKLNQQNMGLLYENEKLLKQINQLRFDKSHLKTKVKKIESKLVYFDAEYTTMKKNADWFYGNYCRFKDMIEKSGYFPGK